MKSKKEAPDPAMPFARITLSHLGGFMRCSRSLFFSALPLLVLSAIGPVPAFAQDPPSVAMGMSPSATYHSGDFDAVDMGTGRLNLHIPLIVDHSQRGKLNFTYSVKFSSTGEWDSVQGVRGFYYIKPPKYGVSSPAIVTDGMPAAAAIETYQWPTGNYDSESFTYEEG
jgi:hypothetical protein